MESVAIKTKIKLISSTLSIKGKRQVARILNNNKWWWQPNFSTHHTIITECSQDQMPVDTTQITHQFQKQLPRLSSVSKEHLEALVIQSIKVTKAISVIMRLNITTPLIKWINSTRLDITILVATISASSQCIAIITWIFIWTSNSILVTSPQTKPTTWYWVPIQELTPL